MEVKLLTFSCPVIADDDDGGGGLPERKVAVCFFLSFFQFFFHWISPFHFLIDCCCLAIVTTAQLSKLATQSLLKNVNIETTLLPFYKLATSSSAIFFLPTVRLTLTFDTFGRRF